MFAEKFLPRRILQVFYVVGPTQEERFRGEQKQYASSEDEGEGGVTAVFAPPTW